MGRIRRDGNGNVIITKETFVILVTLIPLFSIIAGAVSYQVTVQNTLSNHEVRLAECEDATGLLISLLQEVKVEQMRILTNQENMQEDIREIKEAIKEK